MNITVTPVATVSNTRKEVTDDFWGDTITEITLAADIPDNALDGIETFSHLEIIYYFNQLDISKIVFNGHPRGNKAWPAVGIFAQRKKDRINQLGLTTAEFIERKGRSIFVRNLDAIDGTPILDIKPVMREFTVERSAIRQPEWAGELMKDYWASR